MGRITVTLSSELETEIAESLGLKRDDEDLSRLIEDALRAYLAEQRHQLTILNHDRPHRYLRFPPPVAASGLSDVSSDHDKHLAEAYGNDRPEK